MHDALQNARFLSKKLVQDLEQILRQGSGELAPELEENGYIQRVRPQVGCVGKAIPVLQESGGRQLGDHAVGEVPTCQVQCALPDVLGHTMVQLR